MWSGGIQQEAARRSIPAQFNSLPTFWTALSRWPTGNRPRYCSTGMLRFLWPQPVRTKPASLGPKMKGFHMQGGFTSLALGEKGSGGCLGSEVPRELLKAPFRMQIRYHLGGKKRTPPTGWLLVCVGQNIPCATPQWYN